MILGWEIPRGRSSSTGTTRTTRLARTMLALLFCFIPFASALSQSDSSGWFWQNPLPQGNTLYDIIALGPGSAVAVGGSGTVIRTDDGGINWTVIKSVERTRTPLYGVSFVTPLAGWICGEDGKVFYTQ